MPHAKKKVKGFPLTHKISFGKVFKELKTSCAKSSFISSAYSHSLSKTTSLSKFDLYITLSVTIDKTCPSVEPLPPIEARDS